MTSCLQILLVEDNEHISEQIRNALTIQGLNSLVSRVSSQEAFLKAMREQTWDLILAECQIPGFEGMDAIHLARHHNPKIPIILVGEDDAPSFTEEAIKQGAAGFVLRSRLAGLGPAILHAIDRFDRFQTPSAGEERHGSISSFRDFVENVSDWLWEEDANAVLTYSNRHVKELLGYEPQMVLGKSRFHFMPLERRIRPRTIILRAIQSPQLVGVPRASCNGRMDNWSWWRPGPYPFRIETAPMRVIGESAGTSLCASMARFESLI